MANGDDKLKAMVSTMVKNGESDEVIKKAVAAYKANNQQAQTTPAVEKKSPDQAGGIAQESIQTTQQPSTENLQPSTVLESQPQSGLEGGLSGLNIPRPSQLPQNPQVDAQKFLAGQSTKTPIEQLPNVGNQIAGTGQYMTGPTQPEKSIIPSQYMQSEIGIDNANSIIDSVHDEFYENNPSASSVNPEEVMSFVSRKIEGQDLTPFEKQELNSYLNDFFLGTESQFITDNQGFKHEISGKKGDLTSRQEFYKQQERDRDLELIASEKYGESLDMLSEELSTAFSGEEAFDAPSFLNKDNITLSDESFEALFNSGDAYIGPKGIIISPLDLSDTYTKRDISIEDAKSAYDKGTLSFDNPLRDVVFQKYSDMKRPELIKSKSEQKFYDKFKESTGIDFETLSNDEKTKGILMISDEIDDEMMQNDYFYSQQDKAIKKNYDALINVNNELQDAIATLDAIQYDPRTDSEEKKIEYSRAKTQVELLQEKFDQVKSGLDKTKEMLLGTETTLYNLETGEAISEELANALPPGVKQWNAYLSDKRQKYLTTYQGSLKEAKIQNYSKWNYLKDVILGQERLSDYHDIVESGGVPNDWLESSDKLLNEYIDATLELKAIAQAETLNIDVADLPRSNWEAFVEGITQGTVGDVYESRADFVEAYVKAASENGIKITEAQKQRMKQSTGEEVFHTLGISLPDMVELMAYEAIGNHSGALRIIKKGFDAIKSMEAVKGVKYADEVLSFIEPALVEGIKYEAAGQGFLTGVGEETGRSIAGSIASGSPMSEVLMRTPLGRTFGTAMNFITQRVGGIAGQTVEEYTGDFFNNIKENGGDVAKAWADTIGDDPWRRALVIASNAAVLGLATTGKDMKEAINKIESDILAYEGSDPKVLAYKEDLQKKKDLIDKGPAIQEQQPEVEQEPVTEEVVKEKLTPTIKTELGVTGEDGEVKYQDAEGGFYAEEEVLSMIEQGDPKINEMTFTNPSEEVKIAYTEYNKGLENAPENVSAQTQSFFSDVVTGDNPKYKPSKPYEYELEFKENEESFKEEYDTHKGEFDEHIATSIPNFRDVQVKKGAAIVDILPEGGVVYDLGGSEGGFAKSITAKSDGKIKTYNLDPNPDMKAAHEANPVEGSEFIQESFQEGFEDGGVEYVAHKPAEKADVVHESMLFQFINDERASKIKEVKDNYMKEDGIFITEEKFKLSDKQQEQANEDIKNKEYKTRYYTEEQIQAKGDDVLIGMDQNQAVYEEYIAALQEEFEFVQPYWTSGNFRGVAASNNKAKFDQFLESIGEIPNQYTATTDVTTDTEVKTKKEPYTIEEVVESDADQYSQAMDNALSRMKEDGKGLEKQVDPLTKEEAQKIIDDGGKLFVTEDGMSGAYVKADGYMGGLFKNPDATKSNVSKVLQEARMEAGGKYFDAYGTKLEDIYIENGFKPVARLKFNEEFAPEGWNNDNSPLKDKPDVVFFVYDPASDAKKGDGEYFEDYDAAQEHTLGQIPETAQPGVPQEGDTVTLPPRIAGGQDQNFVYEDGKWKQQVGGTTTDISESQQQSVQEAFEAQSTAATPAKETAPPEPPTTEPEAETAEQPPKKERSVPKKGLQDLPISDEIKQGLSEDAKTYIPRANSVTEAEAKAIVESKGLEQAKADVLNFKNDLNPAVRVELAKQVIKGFDAAKQYDEAVDVAEEISKYATELGQGIQAFTMWSNISPEGMVVSQNNKIKKAKKSHKRKNKGFYDGVKKGYKKGTSNAANKATDSVISKKAPSKREQIKAFGLTKKEINSKLKDSLKKFKDASKGSASASIVGLNKDQIEALVEIGYYTFAKGVRNFKEWAAEMKEQTGYDNEGNLRAIWNTEKVTKNKTLADLSEINDLKDTVSKNYLRGGDQTSLQKALSESYNLDEDIAASLAKEIHNEFKKIVKNERKKAISKETIITRSSKKKAAIDNISETDGMNEEAIDDAIAFEYDMEEAPAELLEKLTELENRRSELPDGYLSDIITQEMMNEVDKLSKIPFKDKFWSLWYASVLSGHETQILNATANAMNIASEAFVSTVRQAIVNKDFTVLPKLFKGFAQGIKQSMSEAEEVLATGRSPRKMKDLIEASSTLEKVDFVGGKFNPYNYLKFVGRAMTAVDSMSNLGARGMMKQEVAREMAREKGLRGKALQKEVSKILNNSDDIVQAATKQAEIEVAQFVQSSTDKISARQQKRMIDIRRNEIIESRMEPEFVEKTGSFGDFVTYNYKPEGLIGVIAQTFNSLNSVMPGGITKFVVPFTGVVANVLNQQLDYFPVTGYARAFGLTPSALLPDRYTSTKAKDKVDFQRKLIKASAGLIVYGTLYALATAYQDDDDPYFSITGKGPSDFNKKNQLYSTGWKPYHIKIGNTWINYQYTPLAMPLSILGNWKDAEKYKDLDQKSTFTKLTYAMQSSASGMMDMSFLTGLSGLMDALSSEGDPDKEADKWLKTIGKTGTSFIPNAVKQLDKALRDDTIYETKTVEASLLSEIPIVKSYVGLKPKLNILGQPVSKKGNRFFTDLTDDPNWLMFSAKRYFAPGASPNTKMLDGEVMTQEEFYKYVEISGKYVDKTLKDNFKYYSELDREDFAKEVDKLFKEGRSEAKDILYQEKYY